MHSRAAKPPLAFHDPPPLLLQQLFVPLQQFTMPPQLSLAVVVFITAVVCLLLVVVDVHGCEVGVELLEFG